MTERNLITGPPATANPPTSAPEKSYNFIFSGTFAILPAIVAPVTASG